MALKNDQNNKKQPFGIDLEEELSRPTQTSTHTDTVAQTSAPVPKKENKCRRIYPLIQPSLYNRLNAYLEPRRISMNELVNTLLEEYADKNGL